MNKGKKSRWHRFDAQGNKHIRTFPIGEIPEPIKEDCYTPWMQGNGPFSEEGLKNIREKNSKTHKGVPKSPEQKEKMRLAKLGVPKTLEHRAAMSAAHMGRPKSEAHKRSMREAKRRV